MCPYAQACRESGQAPAPGPPRSRGGAPRHPADRGAAAGDGGGRAPHLPVGARRGRSVRARFLGVRPPTCATGCSRRMAALRRSTPSPSTPPCRGICWTRIARCSWSAAARIRRSSWSGPRCSGACAGRTTGVPVRGHRQAVAGAGDGAGQPAHARRADRAREPGDAAARRPRAHRGPARVISWATTHSGMLCGSFSRIWNIPERVHLARDPGLRLEDRPGVTPALRRFEPDHAPVRRQLRTDHSAGLQRRLLSGSSGHEARRPPEKHLLAVGVVHGQRAAGLVGRLEALHLRHRPAAALDDVRIGGLAGAPARAIVGHPARGASQSQCDDQQPSHAPTSDIRRDTLAAQPASTSKHAARLCRRNAAAGMLPLPANGSRTRSAGRDHCRRRGSRTENGLWFG